MVDQSASPPTLPELAGRLLADAEQRVPLRHTLAGLARWAGLLPGVDGVAVSAVEDDAIRVLTATSPDVESLEHAQAGLSGAPARTAASAGRPVEAADLSADSPFDAGWAAAATGSGWRGTLAVPVTVRGRCRGVLSAYRREPGPFPAGTPALLGALADLAATVTVLADDRDAAVRAQQALAHQALHDPLTGLANRTLLLDRLRHELLGSARRRTPLAVLFVDLDRFKEVNDSLGHAAGDELLVGVARRIVGVLRAQDTVARLGGDEFVAVCSDLPSDLPEEQVAQHVTALADRLTRAVALPPYRLGGADVPVTASVGAVVAVPGEATAESLLREADSAMYRAKRARAAAPATIDLRSAEGQLARSPAVPPT